MLFVWSLQAAVIVALTAITSIFLRNFQAAIRHKIWFCGVIVVALLPVWTLVYNLLPASVVPAAPVTQFQIDSFWLLNSAQNVTPARPQTSAWEIALLVVFTLWLAGILVCASRFALELFKMRRIVRNSIPCGDKLAGIICERAELRLSGQVTNAILTGYFRPVILLPADAAKCMSIDELKIVIAHELAHLRRRDHLTMPLQAVVKAIFFFHPLVRYALARLELERELACDEIVLDGGIAAKQYSELILKIAEQDVIARHGLHPAFTNKEQLKRRIHKIMNNSTYKLSGAWRYLVVAQTLVLLAAVIWFVTPERANGSTNVANGTTITDGDGSLEAEFAALYKKISDAMLNGDKESFESLIADDYSAESFDGKSKVGKERVVELHTKLPEGMKMEKADFSDLKIEQKGDKVVAKYAAKMAVSKDGKAFGVMDAKIIDTWEKRDNRWVLTNSTAWGAMHH